MPTVVHARQALFLGGAVILAFAVPGNADAASGGRYVALGDSYVSGPLIPLQAGGLCLRSSENYPSLTAASLGYTLDDASCSGSTTNEMDNPQTELGLTVNAPELDSVTGDTSLVTLGIGGNDIGFIDIIETCAEESLASPAGDPCTRHYNAGGKDQLAAEIEATGPKVGSVLQQIHQNAPRATVYVVGYPDILPEAGNGCWPVVPLASGDLAYLRQTEKELNQMLADEATVNGATYVDTYTPTVGHDVCRAIGVKWIEGLVPTSPAAPFHPNEAGEAAMAKALEAAIG
ncbi:MAG TPA: SGNH/GDSL hydrolase family protein [Actinospica sp.]|nr:SGNH/GDSL hydrolase family protein [Actinospica sp.]